jgi:uncharacterized protein (TIGR00106 family)
MSAWHTDLPSDNMASMFNGQMCAEETKMLAEFSVVPIGKGESVSQYVAECIKIVESSGIDYRMNPMGTVLEGDYDKVMSVIRACHMRVMELSQRAITSIKIDDRKGREDMLDAKIRSVENKLGKKLNK